MKLCEVMHVRRKTLSFLYKMMGFEVTINAIKVRLEVMTDRSVEKCTWYLTDQPTNRNKINAKQKSTNHILKPIRKLFGIKEKTKLYKCINSWVTLMLNLQSIQSKNIPVYTKQCPFCAETSIPKETKLQPDASSV